MDSMLPLKIFYTKKEYFIFLSIVILVFVFNILHLFFKYENFRQEELQELFPRVENIYTKKNYDFAKLKTKNFVFFTRLKKNSFKQGDLIRILVLTKNISFIQFLKNPFLQSLNVFKVKEKLTFKNHLKNIISKEHNNKDVSSLYSAIFLGLGVTHNVRVFSSDFALAHLLALSGFHLGIIAIFVYFILNIFYSFFHKKYFPFRNKTFDLGMGVILFCFSYLYFIDFAPSFLRAFIMYILAFFFFRRNIKILSFGNLGLSLLLILAFFPKYIFSLSLFFSYAGVFYIFLYLKYFSKLKKIYHLVFFNIWIFLSLLPIIHYFFTVSSFYQLLSPLFSLMFIIFYPLSLILHFIGLGDLFDKYLLFLFSLHMHTWNFKTNSIFLYFCLFLSSLSIFSKKAFMGINILFIIFGFLCFYL